MAGELPKRRLATPNDLPTKMKSNGMPMRILAFDTSTPTCSVAVQADGRIADVSFASSRTHSHHLMQMVDQALGLAGIRVSELDAFAVTRGPGTFTGLRIGISAAKAMALAARKPLLGISGLEALAAQAAETHRLICPMVDARRSEVYCACYRAEATGLRRVSEERVCPPEKVLESIEEPCLFVGNGAELYRHLVLEMRGKDGTVAPPVQNNIHASTLARMAAERFREGQGTQDASLVPQYLRKSDAELKLGKARTPSRVSIG